MAAAVDSGWMPYRDRGQWLLTDDGWYWASDYSWGWAPFHYGRWVLDGRFGWVWVPGNDWAPAWVAWRNTTDGFAGWAPLPPEVVYQPFVGLIAVGGRGGWNVSYGLNAGSFTFVGQEHFTSHNVGRYAAPPPKAAALFAASTPVNNYSFAGGKIVNAGVSASQIAAATKAPVTKLSIKEVASPEAAGARLSGQGLAVFRPNVAAAVAQPKAATTAFRSSAEAPTRPVLINKTPHPAATDAAIARAVAPRPATAAPDYSAQTPHPSYSASPAVRTTPSYSAPAAPAGGWTPFINEGDTRRTLTPSTPAPAIGYPSFSPRGFGSAPPVSTGTGPFYNAPQHNGPVGSAPGNSAPGNRATAGGAPAPGQVDSRGGNGQGSQGNGSQPSSSTSSGTSANPTKPSR